MSIINDYFSNPLVLKIVNLRSLDNKIMKFGIVKIYLTFEKIYSLFKLKFPCFQIYFLILFSKLSFGCPYHPYLAIDWYRHLSIIFDRSLVIILNPPFHACVLNFGESWKDHLHLVKLTYNNSYQV